MLNSDPNCFVKYETKCFHNNDNGQFQKIIFSLKKYKRAKKESRLTIAELENLNVFDPNRYNKIQLCKMTREFFSENDYIKF